MLLIFCFYSFFSPDSLGYCFSVLCLCCFLLHIYYISCLFGDKARYKYFKRNNYLSALLYFCRALSPSFSCKCCAEPSHKFEASSESKHDSTPFSQYNICFMFCIYHPHSIALRFLLVVSTRSQFSG